MEKAKQIALARPTFGTRRMAAMLQRELHVPVNRKRVRRIFHALNWIEPSRKKSETIRSSSTKLVRATRPYELWETDITFVWCGVEGWCYLFNVEDVFQREWLVYAFDASAVKGNAIMSVNNALAAHPRVERLASLRFGATMDPNKGAVRSESQCELLESDWSSSTSIRRNKMDTSSRSTRR
jgi:HTH-like domain